MSTLFAFALLFSVLAFIGSLIGLFFKRFRKKAAMAAVASVGALIGSAITFAHFDNLDAIAKGWPSAQVMYAARDAGVTDPGVWEADRVRREAAAREAAEAEAKAKAKADAEAAEAARIKAEADAKAKAEADARAAEAARLKAEAEAKAKAEADAQAAEAARIQAEADAKAKADADAKAAEAARIRAEAEAKAIAEATAKEATCKSDLRCWAEKHWASASAYCPSLVERMAINNFEWYDGWTEPKFSHYRWKNKKAGIVTYIGDKIKFQNGFGAWIIHTYECDFDPEKDRIVDVRARPGRV